MNLILSQLYKKLLCILACLCLFSCTTLNYSEYNECYEPPLPAVKEINIALVLGGGGAKGLAHVGVIEELVNAGIHPDLIVGCSAGSIVGALYADNPDIYYVKELLFDKRRKHFLELSIEHFPYGLSNGAALHRFLAHHLQAQTFEELQIPFIAVATSLEFGNRVSFGTGELVKPVRASAAIPGVFLPVKINGGYFIDGGVADPVPVKVARDLGAKFIIAVDLSGCLAKSMPKHLFGVLQRSLEIHYLHHSHASCAHADYVIKIPFEDIGTFDDCRNNDIYQLGRDTAGKAIPEIRRLLQEQ